MKRKVLGRGLDALIPGGSRAPDSSLLMVDVDRILPSKYQPRQEFDRELLQELADSIRENGVIQPVILRGKGDRYELIAGERRWRASQLAGLQKIPAVIKSVTDERVLELALIENIQREDLNPLEMARGYQLLVEEHGLTQDQIAKKVGKKRSSVANYLRLLKLPEGVRGLLASGKLEMGHARALAGVEDGSIVDRLAKDVVARGLSVRQAEALVERLASQRKVESLPGPRRDPNVGAAEESLSRVLGARVSIQPTRRGGQIRIKYASSAELDRLYSLILQAGRR